MQYIQTITKAIVAAATAFGGAVALAQDGGITGGEWATIVAVTLVAAFGVWAAPNRTTS